MIEIVEYNDTYKKIWDEYVIASPNSQISHLLGWKNVFEKGLGHKTKYYLALENNLIKGIIPLALINTFFNKKYLISLPWIDYGGICADNDEVAIFLLKHIQQLSDDLDVSFLELRSVNALETKLNLHPRKDKVPFYLKLENDPEILWKRLDGKLRNQIRKSQKSNLSIHFGKEELLKDFYKVFTSKMRDLGTPVWSIKFFQNILEQFPDNSQIILVKKDDKTIASGLVLNFKDRLYVPSAASYRDALKYCPNHALYWAVIEMGCKNGFKIFDFGRSSWNANTFKFKKQWVTDPTQLTWQYYLRDIDQIPTLNQNNPKYKLAVKLWKKLPLSVANYLGPKIIKNFP